MRKTDEELPEAGGYEIRIRGRVSDSFLAAFEDLTVSVNPAETVVRGATLDQAAVWATYLHGAAGNRLKRRMGAIGFLARELSDEIPVLMNGLAGKRGR